MSTPLRIVFMGTPGFAVPSLKALKDAGYRIAGVITSPDKPGGRGNKLIVSEVKQFAIENNISPVLQPEKLKDPAFLSELRSLDADLQIVIAFRMLPEAVWKMPPLGTINLHASLLPQYRGAAPINRVIMNGDKITGITTFFINEDIDTGKIIFQEKVEIPETFTAGDLHDVLMERGAELILKTVRSVEDGSVKEIPQDQLAAKNGILKPAPKIFKEDCRINWTDDGSTIYNFIRGLSPVPTAFSELVKDDENIQVKIYFATFIPASHRLQPGTITIENRKRLKVAVKDGFMYPESLQQAGKKRLQSSEFINGFKGLENYRLI